MKVSIYSMTFVWTVLSSVIKQRMNQWHINARKPSQGNFAYLWKTWNMTRIKVLKKVFPKHQLFKRYPICNEAKVLRTFFKSDYY